ncbi:hypothetical protein H8356DRAFT_996929 [Neocallimastix lanati (nom. inval.)]|nr:hypothetical protein H8356DRAFT_996929 [Neocallimastix sp. JGI-2020a]
MNNQYYYNSSNNSSNNNYYNKNYNYSNNSYNNEKQNKRNSSQYSYNNMGSSGIEDNYPYQLGQYNYYMQQQQPYQQQSQSSFRKFQQQPYNFSQNIEMPSFQNISQNFPSMSQVSNSNYKQKRNSSNSFYYNQSGSSQYSEQNEIVNEQSQQVKKDIKKQLSKVLYMKNISYQQKIKNANILLNSIRSLDSNEISNIMGLLLSYNGLEKIFIDLNASADLKKICIEIISTLSVNGDATINDFIFNWIFSNLAVNKSISGLSKEQECKKKLWNLLCIEKIIISNENKNLLHNYVINILNSLQNLLDSIDTHDYLPIILSIIQTLSQDYPEIFDSKFEEIIDLLIGWYIDPQLPRKILKLIDKTFEVLHSYFGIHIKFIVEILCNLLSDVDTVFEKECIEGQNIATSESVIGESINKKIFLFKCFCSLFYILVKEVIPQNNNIESISEISNDIDFLLIKLLVLLEKIAKVSYLNKWVIEEKTIIKNLSSHLRKLFVPYQYAVCMCSIERMELILKLENEVTELFNNTINDLFEIIEQWVPNLNIDIFEIFFNPQFQLMNSIRLQLSKFNNLNINISVPISKRFFSVIEKSTIYDEDMIPQDIHEVIDCSNGVMIFQIPEFDPITKQLKRKKFRLNEMLVELQCIDHFLIFKYKGENLIDQWSQSDIVSDIEKESEDEFDIEFKMAIDDRKKSYESWKNLENLIPKAIHQIDKVDDSIKELVNNYTYDELKYCFDYDINLLVDIEKHSFIKDLKVKNIFWTMYLLYVNETSRISRGEDYSYWNGIDKKLLNALYLISDYNNHFIYQFNLHKAILQLIYFLIDNKYTNNPQINICINWLKNIGTFYHKLDKIEKLEEIYDICSNILLKLYKRMRYEDDCDTRLLANDTLLYFIDLDGFTETKFKCVDKIYGIIFRNVNDMNTKVCNDLIKVINRINPIITINKYSCRKKKLVNESNFNECVMASQSTGNFKFEHFQLVVRNINLGGELFDDSDSTNGNIYDNQVDNINWLLDLYYICQVSSVLKIVSSSLEKIKGSDITKKGIAVDKVITRKKLLFWAIWEMARYCVLYKLKTTFGNAQQTFEFIEYSLNRIWKTKDINNNYENMKFLNKTKYLGYLIPFIDILELQIYNAYEGTALEKPADFPRNSTIFFSINSRVCEEWFLRIRKLIILDSKIFGTSSSYVVRHCMHYLSDKINYIKQYSKETYNHLIEYEQVIIELVLALQMLKDPDPIIGIYYWMKKLIIQEIKKNSKKKDNNQLQILLQKKPSSSIKESYQYHLEWILVAALLAENKYEEAVVKYRYFLNKYQESSKLSPNLVSFVIKQIIECYKNLNDWDNIKEFLHYIKSVDIENSNYPLCSFENGKNPKLFEAWEDFENSNYHSAYINISKTSPNFREIYESVGMNRAVINSSQYYTLYSMLLINEKNNNSLPLLKSMLNKSMVLVNELLRRLNNTFASEKEMIPAVIQLQLVKIIETLGKGNINNDKIANVLISEINNNLQLNKEVTENIDISILMRVLDIFSFLNNMNIIKDSDYIKKLNYDVAKVARKQCNNILGQKLIKKNLLKIKSNFNVDDIPKMLLFENNPLYVKDYIFELAKIYINEKKYHKGFDILLDLINNELKDSDSDDEDSKDNIEVSKFHSSVYLKTINFLTKMTNSNEFNVEELPEEMILKIRMIAEKAEVEDEKEVKISDLIVQSIYTAACDESNINPKIWCKAANYYYLQAQELLEEMEIGSVDNIKHNCLYYLKKFILEYSEKKVFWSTNKIFNLNQIYSDCLSILTSIYDSSYKIKFENKKINITEMDYKIKKYLFELFPDLNEELLKELLEILNRIKNVLIGYFTDATINYFKYLKYFDEFENDKVEIKKDQECNMTKITLRLLHVFENYGIYIVREYREGFANTPISPWEKIIPQLFARLDHPEPFVQDQICSLICRIGIVSPHLIVYPTIVGISTANTSNNNNDTRFLYQNIIDSLIQSGSEMLVKEIQKMISELQRVTILWEETLLNKLTQLQSEAEKRFSRLKKENERVNINKQLSKEEKEEIIKNNYFSLLNPVIHNIETFYNEINVEPQNNHEKWFHDNYKKMIEDAIKILKDTNNESFQKTWEPFNVLYKEIAKEVQKSRKILLADVSPYLSNIKKSQIPLPGINQKGEIVYIQHFDEYIYALPTKTKPKKINIYGSDGNIYSYLLKGLEDLHLDERIMQLLSCTNHILKINKKSNIRNLQARNYSVVPLSSHLGMIQWVTNATAMFYLYKKWQQRKYAKEVQNIRNNGDGNLSFAIRPHELFYNKLDSQFKKNNMIRGPIRKNWPINIQRNAFLELRHETPKDLIAKEFWTSSSSPTVWWEKTNSYSRSLAVMSIIGYIIGLGDRHLDNILIDFDTGEVIHIDYNVCFEKGKKLCVPETVPFRLTQNLQNALGVYGIEGPFRIACENVLSVLRSNKEILMTILEAFIYDPLVDWSNDYKRNKEKQLMELNVNIGLLSTRIASICPVLKENRELFINNLKGLQHFLKVHMTEISYQDLYKKKEDTKDTLEPIDTNFSESSNIFMFSSKSDISNIKLSSEVQNTDTVEEEDKVLNKKEKEFLEFMRKELYQIYEKCKNKSQQFQTTYGTLHGTFLHNIQNQINNSSIEKIRTNIKSSVYPLINDNTELIEKIMKIFKDSDEWKDFRNNSFENYFKHLNTYQVITATISNNLLNKDYYTNIYKLLNNIFDTTTNKTKLLENINDLNEYISDKNNNKNYNHDICNKIAKFENLIKNSYYEKYTVLQKINNNLKIMKVIEPEEFEESIKIFNNTLPQDMNEFKFTIKLLLLFYYNKFSKILMEIRKNSIVDDEQFINLDISNELNTMFCVDVFDLRKLKGLYLLIISMLSLIIVLFKIAEIRKIKDISFYQTYLHMQEKLYNFVRGLIKISQEYLFTFIPQLLSSINDNTFDIQINLIDSIAKQIEKLKNNSDYQNIREIRNQYSNVINNISLDNYNKSYYNKPLINIFLPAEELLTRLKEDCGSTNKNYYESLEDIIFELKIKNLNESNKAINNFYKSISNNKETIDKSCVESLNSEDLINHHPAFKRMRESMDEFINFAIDGLSIPLVTSELKRILSELFNNLNIQDIDKFNEFEDYVKETDILIQKQNSNIEKYHEGFEAFQNAINLNIKNDLYKNCQSNVKYMEDLSRTNKETLIRYQLLYDYALMKARNYDDFPGDSKEFISLEHFDNIEYTTSKSIREQIIELLSKDIQNLKESISKLRNLERFFNEIYDSVDVHSQKKLLNGYITKEDLDEMIQEIDNIKSRVDTFLLSEHQKFNYLIEFASVIILLESTRIDETEDTNEINYIIALNIKEFLKILNQNGNKTNIFEDNFYSENEISDMINKKNNLKNINNNREVNNYPNNSIILMNKDNLISFEKSNNNDDESILNADYIQNIKNTFDITLKLYKDIQVLTTTALKPAEKIKEKVDCVDEINTIWIEWEYYCSEFVKAVDDLQSTEAINKSESMFIQKISDLISVFETISTKIINLQNISNKYNNGNNKMTKRSFNNRRSSHRISQANRNNNIKSNIPKSNSTKDQYSSLLYEELEFNNNDSDDIINKLTKMNYQFTDKNNEELNNDYTNTQHNHSIEEIDNEISKNNDIIYNIQENIGLSNKIEDNSLSNDNKDTDENDTYTSNTNSNLNPVIKKGKEKNEEHYEETEDSYQQQKSNRNDLLFNEEHEELRKNYSRASSLNTGDIRSRPMMLSNEEESIINSMNLPEEVAETPKISERNLQAMKILYRIRDKLNGYDSQIDPNTMDVTKHVDKVINQAINIDNLACMYEGWTSWI